MKSYSSREVLQKLYEDGWYEVGYTGSHMHLKHRTKKGKVTVTHPKKDIPANTVKAIAKQSGVAF